MRIDTHNHTDYSNIRGLDCISKVDKLIDRAVEIGLSGIAITDHECLSAHVKAKRAEERVRQAHPNFKVILGNEIYLCNDRETLPQKFYHFILLAKDKIGYDALSELSSVAWLNSFSYHGMTRVVTTYDDVRRVLEKYGEGHLIAQSACLGGELSSKCLELSIARSEGWAENADEIYRSICSFMEMMIEWFGDDFYVECAPSRSPDQLKANQILRGVACAYGRKMVVACDSHYIKKEDRFVHKAYLNSQNADREIDSFYQFTYLQSEEEIKENLEFEESFIEEMFRNSMEIGNKIEDFNIFHNPSIVEAKVKDYPKNKNLINGRHSILAKLAISDNVQERYWVNECLQSLKDKDLYNETYLNRLEEEADVMLTIGEKLGTCIIAYPNFLQHYIDLFWECGSIVGPGRGSATGGLNHWLLGITQLNPVEEDLPYFRFLNKERVELPDVDLDLCPSVLPKIFERVRQERGELGVVQIATFKTEKTKNVVLSACRGYRSKEYPNGIDPDQAQYISSLIEQERGFLYTLSDTVNGSVEKGRKPNKTFIKEVAQYPGLLDIMTGIEGLVCGRSSHASGVIFLEKGKEFESCALMRTSNGTLITQLDLHEQEARGNVKYDWLLTDISDKILTCLKLLQKYGKIEANLSIKEAYYKYLAPDKLPTKEKKYWDAIASGHVLSLFQFDSNVGRQAAKKIKPTSIAEMTLANALMRLMSSEKGQETPLDKYVRHKADISLWYQEMRDNGLTEEDIKALEPYFLPCCGVIATQEDLMLLSMDKKLCGFTLGEANTLRKTIAKKQMDKIPEMKAKIVARAANEKLGEYIWQFGALPSVGYSFSRLHSTAYSYIGFQTAYLAVNWPSVYWNAACAIVDSGALDGGSAKYDKIASAIGKMKAGGIEITTPNINLSDYTFSPDEGRNQIHYGLKGLTGVGETVIRKIMETRPFESFEDFLEKVKPTKTVVIALIKSGAFDCFEEDRKKLLYSYLLSVADQKKLLNLRNFAMLSKLHLFGDSLQTEEKIFGFNKYLKEHAFILDNEDEKFYLEHFDPEYLEYGDDGRAAIDPKVWDKKCYQKAMDNARAYIKENQENLLKALNGISYQETLDKYATGSLSSWEMSILGYYSHAHELEGVNFEKYGIDDFFNIPSFETDTFFKRGNVRIPLYKIRKICGTCVAKDKTKSIVTLATTTGIVNVKFSKELFTMFDKQISEVSPIDGKKKVKEKSWFKRGSMIMVQGYRRDDEFVCKKYNKTGGHHLYKITSINNGDISLQSERYQGDFEEDDDTEI